MARILAWLLAASGFLSAAGQQSSTPQAPTQPIGSGVSAIVVDVVVRDAKGRPVTDLTKEDFELREEGVVQ